jgi:hypothetical protein
MQIYACGEYQAPVTDTLPDLKASMIEATGESVRRIGRFIQLALIGAGRCARGLGAPPQTAVYLSSGRGDLETTVDVMTALFRDGLTPKPLSFVNTVSNAACFYVARGLKLQGRSNFVCNRYFAFESVLQLALLDLGIGIVDSALVGSVDVAMTPLPEHRRRLQLSADTPIGEGSHWLWIGPTTTSRPRLGEIITAEHFANRDSLLAWIRAQNLPTNLLLSAGQFLQDEEFTAIRQTCGLEEIFEYRSELGHYDSQSGAGIIAFLKRAAPGQTLLHINADAEGRFSVVLIRK